jgi:hypothetical protein
VTSSSFDISTQQGQSNADLARELLSTTDPKASAKLKLGSLAEQIRADNPTQEVLAALDTLLAKYEMAFPETKLSKDFQLSIVDKTKTLDGVVTGTIEVQYVIPAKIDHPMARADVIKACEAREDRSRPAIWSGDLEWFTGQASEKSDNPAIERVVKYTIDFDSKDTGDGKMNMAGHRAYAEERNAHITPVELQALGAALYYEKTGLDLMKNYWVRAVLSNDGSAPGVALTTYPNDGVCVRRHDAADASDFLVAALSPN